MFLLDLRKRVRNTRRKWLSWKKKPSNLFYSYHIIDIFIRQETDKQREQMFILSLSIQDLIKLKQEFNRVESQLNSFADAENERDSLICAYEKTVKINIFYDIK
jgi:hypothetical protein